MASNFFGQIFRITTFGESHGKGIGVVIDGCPAGLELSAEEIHAELRKRRPGFSPYTSPRKEDDQPEILSGLFEGKTTGAPLAIWIANRDVDSSSYEAIKHLSRPGHGNSTYLQKYGIFDYRGGGRASARETAARVAAGAVAKKFLALYQIEICTFVEELGGIKAQIDLDSIQEKTHSSPIFCPDPSATTQMLQQLEAIKAEGDSLGAILQTLVTNLPPGIGDPIYSKLEANLASAMLSIPATKGFEIDAGFAAARMRGSEHNRLSSGTLAGISTGQTLTFRTAFKPTSSIGKEQPTHTLNGEPATLKWPSHARHDPCVALRAAPIIDAMTALVLADALLLNRCAEIRSRYSPHFCGD
jgi:chorismate synthase